MKKKLVIVLTFSICFGVEVKYQGEIDISHFRQIAISKSSFVKKVLYDKNKLLVKIGNTYYMYCNVKPQRVKQWERKDINASLVYLRYFKGQKEIFCKSLQKK